MPLTGVQEQLSHAAILKPLFQIKQTAIGIDEKIHFDPKLLNQITFNLFLGTAFRTAQGQAFAVNMFIQVAGGPTNILFSASGLPTGVTLDPGSANVAVKGNTSNHKYIHFNVAGDAPIVTNKAVTLHWTAYNGTRSGNLALTFSVWSGFPMQQQTESNWCWAAVSVSMDHYYDPFNSKWTQCQMANAQIGRNDCCQNPGSKPCNIPGYLDDALNRVGRLDHMANGSVTYNTILDQLGKFHPLGIRVAWSGGGAHFICASGHEAGNLVVVDDPIYGTSVVSYNTLTTSYQGSGSWTHSYFTKKS